MTFDPNLDLPQFPDDRDDTGRAVVYPVEMTDQQVRDLFEKASKPQRFVALPGDVFVEHFERDTDGNLSDIPSGVSAGRVVVFAWAYDSDMSQTFDQAIAVDPSVALGIAQRLTMAALFAVDHGTLTIDQSTAAEDEGEMS